MTMEPKELIARAIAAMDRAYVPYSGYRVGAALLCADGKVYEGCNIENGSYGATNCAERTAFFRAVFDGEREFTAIAVCGGKDGIIRDYFPPCGICRQVMREFCEDDFRIWWARTASTWSGHSARFCRTVFGRRIICRSKKPGF